MEGLSCLQFPQKARKQSSSGHPSTNPWGPGPAVWELQDPDSSPVVRKKQLPNGFPEQHWWPHRIFWKTINPIFLKILTPVSAFQILERSETTACCASHKQPSKDTPWVHNSFRHTNAMCCLLSQLYMPDQIKENYPTGLSNLSLFLQRNDDLT